MKHFGRVFRVFLFWLNIDQGGERRKSTFLVLLMHSGISSNFLKVEIVYRLSPAA